MEPNVEFIKEWIIALRSGEYKQGMAEWFKPDSNTYCCLGVLNKISGEELKENGQLKNEDHHDLFATTNKTGLNYEQKKELAAMNDSGNHTFESIADFLENKYIKIAADHSQL